MSRIIYRKNSGFSLLLPFFALAFLMFLWVGCSRTESQEASATSNPGSKAEKSPPESKSDSPGKLDTGRGVLEAMAKAYRSAKTYNDKGTARLMAEAGGKKIDQKRNFAVACQRPNKLHRRPTRLRK